MNKRKGTKDSEDGSQQRIEIPENRDFGYVKIRVDIIYDRCLLIILPPSGLPMIGTSRDSR